MDEPVYDYKTIRTPKHVINTWKIKYPGHDIYYRVRKNLATGISQYQPYCACHNWKHDKWYPHRGDIIDRTFVSEHINEVSKQGQLRYTSTEAQAQDRYGATHFDNIDRLHDHTL